MASQPAPPPKLTPQQLLQKDGRMLIMLDWTQSCLPELMPRVVRAAFAKNHEVLEELLADRRKFRYLFVWADKPPPPPPKEEAAGDDDVDDVKEEEAEVEDEEEDDYDGFISDEVLSRFHFDSDRLSTAQSPLGLRVVFFARRRSGYMSLSTSDASNAFTTQFLRMGRVLQDPVVELAQVFAQEVSAASTAAATALAKRGGYAWPRLGDFLALVHRYSAHKNSPLLFPKMEHIFEVPFTTVVQLTQAEADEIQASCQSWVSKDYGRYCIPIYH